jgi:hypothetical protein
MTKRMSTKQANVNSSIRFRVAIATVIMVQISALNQLSAQCPNSCPPYTPPNGPNLLQNPDFDTVGPCGTFTWWWQGSSGCAANPLSSAAQAWNVHSSNQGDYISIQMVPSTLPIGGSPRMLHIVQRQGGEGGIYQVLPLGLTKVMASAWVFVRRGHVVLQANGGATGPSSWNSKYGEWELLRVCVDTANGTPINWFIVWNEDPNGADFDVDRAEVKVIN